VEEEEDTVEVALVAQQRRKRLVSVTHTRTACRWDMQEAASLQDARQQEVAEAGLGGWDKRADLLQLQVVEAWAEILPLFLPPWPPRLVLELFLEVAFTLPGAEVEL